MYKIYKKIIDENGSEGFILINLLETEADAISELSVLRLVTEDEYRAELEYEFGSHILEL